MATIVARAVHWSPRVLGIFAAVFLSVFALDVFGEGRGFAASVLALFMHLIPTLLTLAVLVIAWRREKLGGILFLVLALLGLVMSRGQSWVVSAPLLVVGALFLLDALITDRRRTGSPPANGRSS